MKEQMFDKIYEKYGTMMLNKAQASEVLGISVAKLNKDINNNTGCSCSKIGSSIKYNIADLVEYMIGDS